MEGRPDERHHSISAGHAPLTYTSTNGIIPCYIVSWRAGNMASDLDQRMSCIIWNGALPLCSPSIQNELSQQVPSHLRIFIDHQFRERPFDFGTVDVPKGIDCMAVDEFMETL